MVMFESTVTANAELGPAVDGAAVILGRGAAEPSGLSRYGGVKICPSGWSALRGDTPRVSPALEIDVDPSRKGLIWHWIGIGMGILMLVKTKQPV